MVSNDTSDATTMPTWLYSTRYKVVGDQSIESYTNFALKQNKHESAKSSQVLAGIAAAVAASFT